MKVGEYPKMPYPQCGRSIKTKARGNNDAPSITKYGSPIRLDAQIVALRLHCACTACALRLRHPLRSQGRWDVYLGSSFGLSFSLLCCFFNAGATGTEAMMGKQFHGIAIMPE